VRPGIQVRIQDSVEVNVELQVGATSEILEVKDTTPLLSTTEASLGQVIDERRVLELPQFAGNAMDLVHLAPGTVNGTNLRLRKAGFNSAPSTFSTDGGGNNQNEFSIRWRFQHLQRRHGAASSFLATANGDQRVQGADLGV
jgi:hypothetical protein